MRARTPTPRTATCASGSRSLKRIEREDEEGEISVETKVLTEQEAPVTDEFKGRIGAQTAKKVTSRSSATPNAR